MGTLHYTHASPLPVTSINSYRVKWDDDTDFGKGVLTDTEIDGAGDSAKVKLEENSNIDENVPFTTPGNYMYNASNIEISGGKAALKVLSGSVNTWPFTTSGNYTFDVNKIEVTGGKAMLKGIENVYAHWHLNESSGTNASDSSGNGRVGTTKNMEDVDWVAAKLNNGLRFDGTNEYVDCGSIADFERTDSFSLECWFKTSGVAQTFFSKMQSVPPWRGWSMETYSGGKIVFNLINEFGVNNIYVRTNLGGWNDNSWHHGVVTYDGSSAASGVKIYIDGALKAHTIIDDSLSLTIKNSNPCCLASRNGAMIYFTGDLDESVIYDKVLTVSEISQRYNSGNGTENALYPLDNPTIETNTGHAFTSSLDAFTETSTKPSGSELKYIISSDNGANYKYHNGAAWVASDGTYSQSNTSAQVHTNINSFAASGTFKFKAFLHGDGIVTPELDSIYIEDTVTYPTGSHEITMKNDIQPALVAEWLSISETTTKPANTDIKYKYSVNGGSSYSATWLTEAQLETEVINLVLNKDGTDKLRFKFQLSSTVSSVTPEIDNLNITGDGGFKASGTFESNIYDSSEVSTDWNIQGFNVVLPTGTTLTFKCRASNDSSSMGSYGPALTHGEDAQVTGRYFQFICEFATSDITLTPELDFYFVDFYNNISNEVSP